MAWETYISFLVAAAMLILIPGPTNLVVLTTGIDHGFGRSVWTVLGASLSHACLIVAASIGLSALLATSAGAFECVRWIGVVYLIWLGVNQWRSSEFQDASSTTRPVRSKAQHLIEGFLTNTTNPKALLFYGVFFPPFIRSDQPFIAQFALLGVTFLLVFGLIALAHGFVGSRLQKIPGKLFHKWQRRAAGSFLVGSGLLLATAHRK